MPAFGIIALVIVLGVLALIPRTLDAMQRHKRLVVILLFGLSGRIGEMVFMSKVHEGMTKRELVTLADQYGGHGPFDGAMNSPPDEVRATPLLCNSKL